MSPGSCVAVRWAAFQARHRVGVPLVATVLALAAGVFGSAVIPSLLSGPSAFGTPGSDSDRVRERVLDATGVDPQSSITALVAIPAGPSAPSSRRRVRRAVALARRDPGVGRVIAALDPRPGAALVSRDGRLAAIAIGFDSTDERAEKETVTRLRGAFAGFSAVRLGGSGPVDREIDEAVGADIFKAELLALPLLFLCLCFVFRGLIAAAIPVLLGLLAVFGALLGLRLGAGFAPLSSFALNLVTGLGLGLAIDYSLLVLTRYREERLRLGPEQALARTLATAGRTVCFSAMTVAGALLVLVTFPQPFVYSMGVGGVCVTLLSGAMALAVLPALLVALDPWLDRFRVGGDRDPARAERRWAGLARRVTARPLAGALVAVAVLVAMALPLLRAEFTFGDVRVLPAGSPARAATEALLTRFPRGSQEPVRVVISAPDGARLPAAAVAAYAARAARLPGVVAVEPPRSLSPSEALLAVRPLARGKDPETLSLVRRLRAEPGAARVMVGGEAAALVDLHESLREHLPLALALVGAWLFLLLWRLSGSRLVALATLAMSGLSLAASLGLLVLSFQYGWLAGPLGFEPEGAIGSAEPIVLLFLVLALTSDYATFLLARIHEERRLGVRGSVVAGVAKTGSVVSSAALLFAIALGAFASSGNVYVKQLGFGATVAVLLDATVVRGLLLPTTMVLLGRRRGSVLPRLSGIATAKPQPTKEETR